MRKFWYFMICGGLPAAFCQFIMFGNEPNGLEFLLVLFWLTVGLVGIIISSEDQ